MSLAEFLMDGFNSASELESELESGEDSFDGTETDDQKATQSAIYIKDENYESNNQSQNQHEQTFSRDSVVQIDSEPELLDAARDLSEIKDFWDLLINEDMIDWIVERTNLKIERRRETIVAENTEQTYHYHTDAVEMRAFIGLLYYNGLWKSCHVNTHQLWDKKNGQIFYRCLFPRLRFVFLMSCLRFDACEKRDFDDKFFAARKIWTIFTSNCKKYYEPSNVCSVNEQFLSLKGWHIFEKCNKSKSDKYGVTLVTLNDASTGYLVFAEPYLEKSAKIPEFQNVSILDHLIEKVTEPIRGSNRTVVSDNWLSSTPQTQHILANPSTTETTIKEELPEEEEIPNNLPETNFCHTNGLTLLPSQPKIQKLDQMGLNYTTARATSRWPMRVFFAMLDQAMVNARIMWKLKHGSAKKPQTSANIAMQQIIDYLTTPMLKRRLENGALCREIKINIQAILNIEEKSETLEKVFYQTARRCRECARKRDRKTKIGCSFCKKPICDDHRHALCHACIGLQTQC